MKIKFHITPIYPYGDDHYFHEIIAVAEGFKTLGHTIYGNANYWWQPEHQEYLIKEDKSKDFDIAVYDYRYAKSFEHLLFREGYPNFDKSKKHVLIDRNDWLSPIWMNNDHYKIYDIICAGNLYKNYKYPSNVKPWSIGITNRIMSYIDKTANITTEIDPIAGFNFRVKHNMRGYLLKNMKELGLKFPVTERFTDSIQQTDIDLSKIDKSYWKQSSKRHNPAYYNLLNKTLLFFSFGGYYEFKPLIYQPYTFLDKLKRKPAYWKYKKKKQNNIDFSDEIFIFQQDNFRFWEVLYSNSTPVNLNFEYWNFLLPVFPVDGKHYLGVKELDGKKLKQKLEKLSPEEIKAIGKSGRDWCNENYSPKAVATRILDYLNLK